MNDGWPKGAIRIMSNLDMLTEEPLELAVALHKLAQSTKMTSTRRVLEWALFEQAMGKLIEDLKGANEPPAAA